MKIGVPLSKDAYTPESYAYEKYLTRLGHQVQVDYKLDPDNDINIHYMGFHPFYRVYSGRAKIIHEYQSLSTFPYAKLKDLIKVKLAKKPDGRIFLNKNVHKKMNFNDDIPFIYRDMGVDDILFQEPNTKTVYDIVYCGSISGRFGLIDTLLLLSKKYKIIVLGKITKEEKNLLSCSNITVVGEVKRGQLSDFFKKAKYGLNFMPDIYPYNIQTSTKVLEYLASGLEVISSRYEWIEKFSEELDYEPIWLEDIENTDLSLHGSSKLSMIEYSWSNVLEKSGFEDFLKNILESK